jgi:16S rRNA G966 N2-methylase RsmD
MMVTFKTLSNRKDGALPKKFLSDDNRNPKTLVRYILKQFTKKNDIVLDIFAGLGTTLIVAEELGRIPFGVECDQKRAQYIKTQVKHKENVICGTSLNLLKYQLPQCDFCFTSPPYMSKTENENPLASYHTKGSYQQYLKDIRKIYSQIKKLMRPESYAVIEVSNLKGKEVTTLAWDIAREISKVLHFEGEIIIGWKGKDSYGFGGTYGYGYDHSYCLVFKKKR